MKKNVKIKVDIDPSVTEPEVIIRAKEEDALVKKIVASVEQCTDGEDKELPPVQATWNNISISIEQRDIIRVFSEDRRIIVWTKEGGYQAKCTLKELEEILDADWFVRISRFEIINLKKVSGFDMSIKGTMKVSFDDGSFSWVSRRFVIPVQQRLSALARRGGKL